MCNVTYSNKSKQLINSFLHKISNLVTEYLSQDQNNEMTKLNRRNNVIGQKNSLETEIDFSKIEIYLSFLSYFFQL